MLDYIIADAHEGPVCSVNEGGIFFTTVPDYNHSTNKIKLLDVKNKKSSIIFNNANMANSMRLSKNKKVLWVAEQGNFNHPGGITKLSLDSFKRYSVVNSFKDKPFNSPNKIIESRNGILYFSDVDYGYLQGFKPKPKLKNTIYAYSESAKKMAPQ